MKSFRLLFFVLAMLTAGGCWGGNNKSTTPGPGGQVAASVTGGGRVLLDPLATSVVIGTILLANTLATGTVDGDILFRLNGNADIEPEMDEVRLAPGETRQVTIRALTTVVAVLALVVIAEYVVSGLTRNFGVQWTNAGFGSAALLLLGQFGNPQLAQLWFASAILAPIAALVLHSSNLVPPRIPSLLTEIRMFGAMLLFFTLAELQQTFAGAQDGEAFPLGQGQHGYTVRAEPSVPLTQGEYCTFWMSTSGTIPLADPSRHYQYAFVMDSDASPANNYTASPSFPNDFFQGTDRWYELVYTPQAGWQLKCKVITAGNTITTVASAAHMVIRDDSIVLFVPRSEFVLSRPPFRATSFCHDGDFGLNPPHEWGGDPTPTVVEALHAW